MSTRLLLAILTFAQFGLAHRALAATSISDEDHYVLSAELQLPRFEFEDEAFESSLAQEQTQTLTEAAQDHINDMAIELGSGSKIPQKGHAEAEADEKNSTVVLPAGTRFQVIDAVIDEEAGEKYLRVETESGFKFWTPDTAFDQASYVAEVEVAGKSTYGKPGWRIHPSKKNPRGRCHEGTDIGMPNGTPLGARMAGTVVFAGWMSGYGKMVEIHQGKWMTRYGHMSQISVKVGQKVSVGTKLGRSGSTGNATGPHLHYEHKINGTSMCKGRKL